MIKKFLKSIAKTALENKWVYTKTKNILKLVENTPDSLAEIGSIEKPLMLPPNETEETLFDYLLSFAFENENSKEMKVYLESDFKRFVYTLSLVPDTDGSLLEIGANPYFTTLLLQKFRNYKLFLTNYFETYPEDTNLHYQSKQNSKGEERVFSFYNTNVEKTKLPFEDSSMDVVLLCEVIEHFVNDPLYALQSIKRVLKPSGYLILTTPNVARLENVAKLIVGQNLYDPYSGYGPYGRHNREYNKHELFLLLRSAGFEIEEMYSSDVYNNLSASLYPAPTLLDLVRFRKEDLGQYIFIKAKNIEKPSGKKPSWLYRSYPEEELENYPQN